MGVGILGATNNLNTFKMKENYEKYNDSELFAMMHGKRKESETAFAELYSRYSQRVFSYCLRVLGDKEDAKDVFQESFISFYNSRENYRSLENVFGFLLKTTRNLCLNYKRNRKPSINIDDYKLSTNDIGYEQKELLEIIAQSLELLSIKYKEVFVLRLYHGLNYSEIAKITGSSETSVRNKVWRAKEKLKKILSPYLNEISKI